MTKTIATMPINYKYDADHARAHYLIEGETAYKNGGEFAEIVCKAIRGFNLQYGYERVQRVHKQVRNMGQTFNKSENQNKRKND